MREILFRGKRVDNGEWVVSCGVLYATKTLVKLYNMHTISNSGWVNVDPATVGQYTGLKDKNGRKVFEGDLVIAEWHFTEPTEVDMYEIWRAYYEMGLNDEMEIIGNIHDGGGSNLSGCEE